MLKGLYMIVGRQSATTVVSLAISRDFALKIRTVLSNKGNDSGTGKKSTNANENS